MQTEIEFCTSKSEKCCFEISKQQIQFQIIQLFFQIMIFKSSVMIQIQFLAEILAHTFCFFRTVINDTRTGEKFLPQKSRIAS